MRSLEIGMETMLFMLRFGLFYDHFRKRRFTRLPWADNAHYWEVFEVGNDLMCDVSL